LLQVAAMLEKIHALPVPVDLPLRTLDPFVRLPERIGQAVTLPSSDRAWLVSRLAELEGQWATLESAMPRASSTAMPGLATSSPPATVGVVLLDLERCSVGPLEWDLVSSAVKYATYGQVSTAEWQHFCDAYGRDVTTWSGFPVLRDIREFRMTCYAAQQAASHPRLAAEATLRVTCLKGQHGPRPWPWTPL
jgi:hypothetical protein